MTFGKFLDRTAAILVQPRFYFKREEDGLNIKEGSQYAAIMGALGMIIGTLLGTRGLSSEGFGVLVASLIIAPIAAVLTALIMGALIHLFCQFLGSRKDFAASFGIACAASALYPVTAIIDLAPGIGAVVGLLWSWWLISQGASGIHRIDPGSTRILFGLIYAVLALFMLITA